MTHSLWNEVAPVAPLLIDLATVLGALVVIALCTVAVAFMGGMVYVLNKTVGRLPLIGGVISVAVTGLVDGFTTALAGWSHDAHRALGAALHSLARAVDWLGHELEQHSKLLNTIAGLLIGPATLRNLRELIHRLIHGQTQQQTVNKTQARVNKATHSQTVAAQREAHVAHKTAVAIPGQVAREWDIPKLREQVRGLEDGALDTWKWIRSHPLSLATAAFAGAVAVALQRIGASWIRCSNWKNIGKVGCGLETDALTGLLGALFTVEAIANLRTLVELAQETEHAVAAGIQDLLDV